MVKGEFEKRKRIIVSGIEEIHDKAFRRVGSMSAVLAADIKEYDKLQAELVKLDRGYGFKKASGAATGKPFNAHVARCGDVGIFYSDLPAREYGGGCEWREIKFDNPIVFKDQWDAVEKLFGRSKADPIRDKYKHLKEEEGITHLGTLTEAVSKPKVVSFWAMLDRKIIKEVLKKGHDGIVYHHGKGMGNGEYVDIKRLGRQKTPITIAMLRRIHTKRSPLAQASDERQKHQVTIKPDSPKVKQWLKDPSSADIAGIDTPRLGRKSPRITPPTPKLKR